MPAGIITVRLLVLLFVSAPALFACTCIVIPPCAASKLADVIFTGKVKGTAPEQTSTTWVYPSGSFRVSFAVTERFAGLPKGAKTVEILSNQFEPLCGDEFEPGKEYIVYAKKNSNGQLTSDQCTRSRLLSRASEDLTYFTFIRKGKLLPRTCPPAQKGRTP